MTTVNSKFLRQKYLHENHLPTMFCPGCGLGTIINIVTRAFENLGMDKDKTILVSGIGCTARIPGYFELGSLHTTHGRALPLATAIKLTNPDLNVIVISGDGDLIGIGGNHFIHAVRRNVGIKVIAANNLTYGMTGGQNSPTTPHGALSTSYPWGGSPEDNIDMSALALVGGAPFVARWTTFHPVQARKSIENALSTKGFSFVEMLSPCPTNFGRRNRLSSSKAMKDWINERTQIVHEDTNILTNDNSFFIDTTDTKWSLGEFQNIDRITFEEKWKINCDNAKEKYFKMKKEE